MTREKWGTRVGFILAAVGSAIGLGNIWRFPYVAFKNGGGAFMIPYLFAILTTGVFFVALEFIMGKKYRGSAPLTYFRINKNIEFIGWWQFLIAFVIMTYYAVILAWATNYIGYSATLAWGSDTQTFFYSSFLNISDVAAVGSTGGVVWKVLIALLVIWLVTLGTVFRGVKKGIERLNKIALPLLIILFLIFVIRGITLPGAVDGLNAFFTPSWSSLGEPSVWIAAYSQIFYSLSLAMGIMITYSSYLPRKMDTTNNAFIAGFANSSFELLAGIGIFAAIGFMAQASGITIQELAVGGIGLAFVVIPQIINQLPASAFFGVLFFSCLLLAGITSLISLVEVCISAVIDKFSLSRQKTVLIVGTMAVLISVFYTTRGGIYLLDVVDNFINSFAILPGAVVEIILVLWVFKQINVLRNEANLYSQIKLGNLWKICLGIITPIALIIILATSFVANMKTVYGGYSEAFVATFGWGMVAALPVIAFLLSRIPWKDRKKAEAIPEGEDE